jgi:hypothetical protein
MTLRDGTGLPLDMCDVIVKRVALVATPTTPCVRACVPCPARLPACLPVRRGLASDLCLWCRLSGVISVTVSSFVVWLACGVCAAAGVWLWGLLSFGRSRLDTFLINYTCTWFRFSFVRFERCTDGGSTPDTRGR